MRIFVILTLVIALFAASCTPPVEEEPITGPGYTFVGKMDTAIAIPFPKTTPLYSCATGQKTGQEKILDWDGRYIREVSQLKKFSISNQELEEAGYTFSAVADNTENSAPAVPWGWLVFFVVCAIIILAIFQIAKEILSNKKGTEEPAPEQQQVVDPEPGPTLDPNFQEALGLLRGKKGSVKRNPDGGFEITIK